ncbi:MAG: Gfo/Idh/MocA family protein [Sphingobacteriaceae bacterium]
MERIYGFALIGTGAIARMHAHAIQAIPHAKLIAVYNHNMEKAVQFAQAHQTRAYGELKELLDDPLVDIVCICTPSGAHLEPALAAIARGKHCLIEKPLEITSARCAQIIQAAEKKGVQVSTIFPSRFHPAAQTIKTAMENGKFGNLVLANAYVKWSRTPDYYRAANWRGTWALDGGGALMNQGIHAVDLLLWYMGPVDYVQAISANRMHLNIEVEDTIVAQLKFQSGALGTIECTTAAFSGSPKTIEIIGTQGRIALHEEQITSWEFADVHENQGEITDRSNELAGGQNDPMAIGHLGHQRQIEDFLQALTTGHTPRIASAEGAKAVSIIEAIYQSARQKSMIKI